MLRRNFLRNAAFTLPVAMVAPKALLASDSNNSQKAGIIIVGTGEAASQAAKLLAADNADLLVLEPSSNTAATASTLTQKQITKIDCSKQGFLLTDRQGNTYSTTKVIFATPASYCDSSARVHVQTTASKKVTLSIKLNGTNSATCWAASANKVNTHLLSAFASSNKVSFMCLA